MSPLFIHKLDGWLPCLETRIVFPPFINDRILYLSQILFYFIMKIDSFNGIIFVQDRAACGKAL